jgi:excinuclease ABC subunit B
MTGSMERAIGETNRRRDIQEAFNKENSIQPKGIKKKIGDIMEGARSVKGKSKTRRKLDKLGEIEFDPIESFNDPEKIKKEIVKIEDQMYKYAKNLEFEEAASYRDRGRGLKKEITFDLETFLIYSLTKLLPNISYLLRICFYYNIS